MSTGEIPDVDSRAVSDGWVRIVGFGSLLARSSAARSFPTLRDFRLVRIPNAVRVFSHPATIFVERGLVKPHAPYELSSLSVEPSPIGRDGGPHPVETPAVGTTSQFTVTKVDAENSLMAGNYICATAFEIEAAAMREFLVREPEFAYVAVQPYSMDTTGQDGRMAIMCGRGSDALLRERLGGSDEAWHDAVTKNNLRTIWNQDKERLLPCRAYLRLCVLAAEKLGIGQNFLDSTFLADRRTPVRQHVASDPTILVELPPEHVAHFYTP